MRAAVEGYQVTTAGLRLLGSGEVSSEGWKCQGSRHRWPSSPPPPPGETLHGLAKRHDISRNLIRVWVAK